MSAELERLNKLLEHDDAYFKDNIAMMSALVLILKRQECAHSWIRFKDMNQMILNNEQMYICQHCELKETRF